MPDTTADAEGMACCSSLPPKDAPPSSASYAQTPEDCNCIPSFDVPPGWTKDPPGTTYAEEWEGPDSHGQTIARCYGWSQDGP
ncbi:hypothetical protein N7532_002497 [Penicillium argentinense]|uniref:Uncharacterized protein n=1 Tax=Penicillium argentinense TaxID=1131581 RepID=A0A9W9G232_9EURO|nr:uncharacterized protein N7532_002497 [Penicillium argentinense]KAJ5109852.1 hypothetical protein N7532_002497 [Penicillium argentinense]